MEMTSEQRLAMQQESQPRGIGFGENSNDNAGYGQEESVWDVAKRFAKGVGDQVTKINERYGGGGKP